MSDYGNPRIGIDRDFFEFWGSHFEGVAYARVCNHDRIAHHPGWFALDVFVPKLPADAVRLDADHEADKKRPAPAEETTGD